MPEKAAFYVDGFKIRTFTKSVDEIRHRLERAAFSASHLESNLKVTPEALAAMQRILLSLRTQADLDYGPATQGKKDEPAPPAEE